MGPEIPTAAADQNFAWICKQHQDLIGSVPSFRTKIIWSGPEFGLVRCRYLNAAIINVYAKFHHNIPHSSRNRTIFHFFRLWSSANLRPIYNVISQSLGLDLVNINVYAKVYQNIPLSHFHFFRIWHSAKPRPMINVILQSLWLDLFNIKLSAKCYQNIPNGLRVKFHFFQNLNRGKSSTNPKCHLTIQWATTYQYQCVCKISSQYSSQFKR